MRFIIVYHKSYETKLFPSHQLRRLLSVICLAEPIKSSVFRARCCELLADHVGRPDSGSIFTLGLFSRIDALLDDSVEHLPEILPLEEIIGTPLRGMATEPGPYLELTDCYERGLWADERIF